MVVSQSGVVCSALRAESVLWINHSSGGVGHSPAPWKAYAKSLLDKEPPVSEVVFSLGNHGGQNSVLEGFDLSIRPG